MADKFNRAKLGKVVKEENLTQGFDATNTNIEITPEFYPVFESTPEFYSVFESTPNFSALDVAGLANDKNNINHNTAFTCETNLNSNVDPACDVNTIPCATAVSFATQQNINSIFDSNLNHVDISRDRAYLEAETVNKSSRNKNRRTYIPLHTKRDLLRQSGSQCEFVSSAGHRCDSAFQLQIDHRMPLALGGTNEKSNLQIFCRTHNLLAARQWGLGAP